MTLQPPYYLVNYYLLIVLQYNRISKELEKININNGAIIYKLNIDNIDGVYTIYIYGMRNFAD